MVGVNQAHHWNESHRSSDCSCQCRPHRFAHPRHAVSRNRGRKEKALAEFAAKLAKQLQFILGFDPLGEDGHAEHAAKRDDPLEQPPREYAPMRGAHEAAVDLDDVRAKHGKVGERGVAGAEVIESDGDLEMLEVLDSSDRRFDIR